MADGIWFVYRSPYDGPSGKRVCRLPDPTVLAWFQRMWALTTDQDGFDNEADAHGWVEQHLAADLAGTVYGLTSVFTQSGRDGPVFLGTSRRGPLPATDWRGLRGLLRRDLYVEGDPHRNIRVDEHSLRAKTDDDEVDLAYFFFDDALAASRPDRAAYLLHDDWQLPEADGAGGAGFREPVGVRRLTTVPGGTGTTYAVLLTCHDEFGEPPPVAFRGVRLPELAEHLRALPWWRDGPGGNDRRLARARPWTYELLALRALTAPGDRGIGPALRRYKRWAGQLEARDLTEQVWASAAQDHPTAHARIEALLRAAPPLFSGRNGRDPRKSRVREAAHIAQAAIHVHELFGYERWYLFDDVWASAHPDLAASVLRCAMTWDPFGS